jgi:putative N-acetylmannosamine-6-phosphate epimerase
MDLAGLQRGLIVSCQAHGDYPLRDHAVVVGTAVTNPLEITARFVEAARRAAP